MKKKNQQLKIKSNLPIGRIDIDPARVDKHQAIDDAATTEDEISDAILKNKGEWPEGYFDLFDSWQDD